MLSYFCFLKIECRFIFFPSPFPVWNAVGVSVFGKQKSERMQYGKVVLNIIVLFVQASCPPSQKQFNSASNYKWCLTCHCISVSYSLNSSHRRSGIRDHSVKRELTHSGTTVLILKKTITSKLLFVFRDKLCNCYWHQNRIQQNSKYD